MARGNNNRTVTFSFFLFWAWIEMRCEDAFLCRLSNNVAGEENTCDCLACRARGKAVTSRV